MKLKSKSECKYQNSYQPITNWIVSSWQIFRLTMFHGIHGSLMIRSFLSIKRHFEVLMRSVSLFGQPDR